MIAVSVLVEPYVVWDQPGGRQQRTRESLKAGEIHVSNPLMRDIRL
jgi:hypothetical protein